MIYEKEKSKILAFIMDNLYFCKKFVVAGILFL